jgi:hypothetical protein
MGNDSCNIAPMRGAVAAIILRVFQIGRDIGHCGGEACPNIERPSAHQLIAE